VKAVTLDSEVPSPAPAFLNFAKMLSRIYEIYRAEAHYG